MFGVSGWVWIPVAVLIWLVLVALILLWNHRVPR